MKKSKRPNRSNSRFGGPRPQNLRKGNAPKKPSSSMPQGRIIAGIHAVTEALKVRPNDVSQVWMKEKYEDSQQLNVIGILAAKDGVTVVTKPVSALDKILTSHQGTVAFVNSEPEFDLAKTENMQFATLIVLDGVQDPHNLGAVLRTAWLLNVNAVLVPDVRAASLSPAVSKVAQGACEHVAVIAETSLSTTLEDLKTKGFWIFGLSHDAPQTLYETKIPEKVVWVLGAEDSGVRKPLERLCDSLVCIPQSDPDASFNVSVAAALALGETFRQRTAFEP